MYLHLQTSSQLFSLYHRDFHGLCFWLSFESRNFFEWFLDFVNDPSIYHSTVRCLIFKDFSFLFLKLFSLFLKLCMRVPMEARDVGASGAEVVVCGLERVLGTDPSFSARAVTWLVNHLPAHICSTVISVFYMICFGESSIGCWVPFLWCLDVALCYSPFGHLTQDTSVWNWYFLTHSYFSKPLHRT